ncbi:MAG: hypothetical protein AB1555_12590 [Nitrospirota bacterium]
MAEKKGSGVLIVLSHKTTPDPFSSIQEVVIDLLLADSEYLRTALSRRRIVKFDSLQTPILTIEDLIVLKTLAGRLQDQADLEKIRARQDDLHIDWNYAEKWSARLGFRT